FSSCAQGADFQVAGLEPASGRVSRRVRHMTDSDRITAQLEILTLKARHLRQLDTKDWAGYGELLTDDYVLDVSAGTNIPIVRGREAALAKIQTQIGAAQTVHKAHLPQFELGVDEANVVWPIQDRLLRGPNHPSLGGYGHHHDRWVR